MKAAGARAEQLIGDLLAVPSRFTKGYELLQAYLKGAPVETLRPLLRGADETVRREAVWVVSELGRQAFLLLDDVVPLIDSGDRYLAFHAMESVTLCATGAGAPAFAHVVARLEDADEVLRTLSMFLMSNVDVSQLAATVDIGLHNEHEEGLRLLLDPSASEESVLSFINSDEPLRRRYGAIAAARLYEKCPRLMDEVSKMEDAEVGSFIDSVLRMRRGRRPGT